MSNTSEQQKSALSLYGLMFSSLLSIGALAHSTDAQAGVYKCTDATGNISYNQMPCPVDTKTQTVLQTTSTKKPTEEEEEEEEESNKGVGCSVADSFARKTATQMRSGMSSSVVFAAYGGVDVMPRTSIGVVNYIFTHKDNQKTNIERLVGLSSARCNAGSYGAVGCEDFPQAYVSEIGGCANAKQQYSSSAAASKAIDENAQATATPAALGVRTETVATPNQCKLNIEKHLTKVASDMQAAKSSDEIAALKKRSDALQAKINEC